MEELTRTNSNLKYFKQQTFEIFPALRCLKSDKNIKYVDFMNREPWRVFNKQKGHLICDFYQWKMMDLIWFQQQNWD